MHPTLTDEQAAHLGRLVDVYPEARELGERFAAAGHELHLVGGTVRDTLLAGGDPDRDRHIDLDFATTARPDETEQLSCDPWATAVWLTGAAFGTVSCQRDEPGRPRGPSRSPPTAPTSTSPGPGTPRSPTARRSRVTSRAAT
jgi:poly(A) polymerase